MRRWFGFALAVCLLASLWGASEARINPRYLEEVEGDRTTGVIVGDAAQDDYEFLTDLNVGALWFPALGKKGYVGYSDITAYYPGGGDQSVVWQAGMWAAGYVSNGWTFYDNAFRYMGNNGKYGDPGRYNTIEDTYLVETEDDFDYPYPYRKITIHVNTANKSFVTAEGDTVDGDMGLDVTYEWHQWGVDGYDDFVFVHVTIEFTKDIEDFYWGWCSDCDCGDVNLPDYYFDDYAGWDEDLEFCYMRDWDYDPLFPQAATPFTADSLFLTPNAVGQVLLAAPPVGGPVTASPISDQKWISKNFWDWNNDISGAQDVFDRLAGIWENPFPPDDDFDYRILNGVGPYDITAGQVGEFWMAYVVGEGYDETEHATFGMGTLVEHVVNAQEFFDAGMEIPPATYPPRTPDIMVDVRADTAVVDWSSYVNYTAPGVAADSFVIYTSTLSDTSSLSKLGPWDRAGVMGGSEAEARVKLIPGFYTYIWVQAIGVSTQSNPYAMTSRIYEPDSRGRIRANENTIVGVIGATPAEVTLDRITVAPNPYIGSNQAELTEYETLLGFHYLPEKCDIYIYTLLGNLVDLIHHGYEEGSPGGSEFWDMTTRTQEAISSGLYVYRVVTEDGDEKIGKFAVIKGQR